MLSINDKMKIQTLYFDKEMSLEDIAKKIKKTEYIIGKYINSLEEKIINSIEIRKQKENEEEKNKIKNETNKAVIEAKKILKEKGLTDDQIEGRIHMLMSQKKPPKKTEIIVERAMKLSPITESIITKSAGANKSGQKRQVSIMTEAGSQKLDGARVSNKGKGRLGKHIFKIRNEEEGRY